MVELARKLELVEPAILESADLFNLILADFEFDVLLVDDCMLELNILYSYFKSGFNYFTADNISNI